MPTPPRYALPTRFGGGGSWDHRHPVTRSSSRLRPRQSVFTPGSPSPARQEAARPRERLGPDPQARPAAPRRRDEAVEVGLAVGHREDRAPRGQGGLGGGQGVEPALTLLAGGLGPGAPGALALVRGVAGPAPLVDQAQGDALGAEGRGRGRQDPPAIAMPQLAQAGGGGMVGEVQGGGVPDGQDRPALVAREAPQGAAAMRGAEVDGVDARVIPEAIGGLGGGPIARGQGAAGLGLVGQVVDQGGQASIQAQVPEVDMAEFECGPQGRLTNPITARSELVGNA